MKKIIYGIQGGKGSFNEQAILKYLKDNAIQNASIKYLYTSEKVLREVNKGTIHFGLFAIHNSIGGIVGESLKAMSRHNFHIVKEFAIPICHYLMKRKDVDITKIDTIMAHPQVLAQCKSTLEKKYKYLILTSGKGNLVDTATAAKELAKNNIPKTTAILGPKILASLYSFDIIDEDLQDDKTNNTAFLLVKRRSVYRIY